MSILNFVFEKTSLRLNLEEADQTWSQTMFDQLSYFITLATSAR